jgi:multidrug efflux pump subunit AcrA (membrane-fusion protein)
LAKRYELEERLLKVKATSSKARAEQQELELLRSRSHLDLKRRQLAGLQVRAGMAGVVQQIGGAGRLQEGQAVAANAVLAKIIQPGKLRAEVTIPESVSWEIEIGQPAFVETRGGNVAGRVAGIDPVVSKPAETVTVYVALEGKAPKGIRPGSTAACSIEIERLSDVLHVERALNAGNAGPNSQVSLFKITEDGKAAVRVSVKLGRCTPSRMQVLAGLREGDQVILSDTSAFDKVDRISLL